MTVINPFEKPEPGAHAAAAAPPIAPSDAPAITPAAASEPAPDDGFLYTFRSGESLLLPRFADVMTFGRGRRIRHLSEPEQMFALAEDVCDEAALAVLDKMNASETVAFFTAWEKHSGVRLGESSA